MLGTQEDDSMPRAGWTEERRRKFEATMAAKYGRKPVRVTKPGGAPVAPRETALIPVRAKVVNGSIIGQIDDEIARRKDELAALEKTREILEGAR
jgi:hypothetical protein